MGGADRLRVAVAQVEVPIELPSAEVLAASGARVRSAMQEAAAGGARLVQFPESTLVESARAAHARPHRALKKHGLGDRPVER